MAKQLAIKGTARRTPTTKREMAILITAMAEQVKRKLFIMQMLSRQYWDDSTAIIQTHVGARRYMQELQNYMEHHK